MPIRDIQKRHAELGRIRLGEKKTSSNGKTYPSKLSKFRFTSPGRRHIEALASLYGGTAREWDNGGSAEFEVFTEATSIPVVVVRGGLSQWLETWSGGGCTHRCDGYNNVLTGEPCDPDDPNHVNAKPTTRLSVMLPQLEAIGVWRMESHGWNAAAEIPGVAELAQMVGELVPANLTLHERKAIRDGKISRFVVPGLDLEVSTKRLVEIANAQAQGIAPPPAGQLGGGAPAQIGGPAPDFAEAVADATSPEELKAIWRQAGESGHLTDDLKAAITAAAEALKTPEAGGDPGSAEGAAPGASAPPVSGNTNEDRADAWMRLVMAAGKLGVTEPELRTQLEQAYAQPVSDLTADQLEAFIEQVQGDQDGAA